MKTSLVILASVLLVLGMVGVAFAASFEEESLTASVNINQYVSITLTDAGAAGISFGSLNSGDSDKPEVAQTGSIAAVKVKNDAISNANIKVNVKGAEKFCSDYPTCVGNTFVISKVTYDDDNTPSEGTETGKAETAMANDYPGTDYYTSITPNSEVGFWFFMDVPAGQSQASYSSQFTFKGAA